MTDHPDPRTSCPSQPHERLHPRKLWNRCRCCNNSILERWKPLCPICLDRLPEPLRSDLLNLTHAQPPSLNLSFAIRHTLDACLHLLKHSGSNEPLKNLHVSNPPVLS